MRKSEKISMLGLVLNAFLFSLKLAGAVLTGSLAVLSDAMNSFIDIFSSTLIFFAVRVSNKAPDASHPFGHRRAEPLAALTVAILTGILGFEIIRTALFNLFSGNDNEIGVVAIVVLAINIVIKLSMAYYFTSKGEKMNRPAILATGVDARNDVMVSLIALAGVSGTMLGFSNLDNISAIFISGYIFYSGYHLAVDNIDYLMGRTPPQATLDRIRRRVLKVVGIRGINDVRAHYVGSKIHIEIHIEVDKDLSTKDSHDLGKAVQARVESLGYVDKAFIHIDPV